MLDVTGCTCPTGVLWKGVYDVRGVQYRVPEWVVVEPEGLVEEGEDGDGTERGSIGESGKEAEIEGEEGETRMVRVRTSHNQKDVTVGISTRETVASIVRKAKKCAEVCVFSALCLDVFTDVMYSSTWTLACAWHMAVDSTRTTRRWNPTRTGTLRTNMSFLHWSRKKTSAPQLDNSQTTNAPSVWLLSSGSTFNAFNGTRFSTPEHHQSINRFWTRP